MILNAIVAFIVVWYASFDERVVLLARADLAFVNRAFDDPEPMRCVR